MAITIRDRNHWPDRRAQLVPKPDGLSLSAQPWEAEMRASNKRAKAPKLDHSPAQGVHPDHDEAGSRSAAFVLTEVPWQPDKSLSILNAVQEIRVFIEKGNSIQETNEMRLKTLRKASDKARTTGVQLGHRSR